MKNERNVQHFAVAIIIIIEKNVIWWTPNSQLPFTMQQSRVAFHHSINWTIGLVFNFPEWIKINEVKSNTKLGIQPRSNRNIKMENLHQEEMNKNSKNYMSWRHFLKQPFSLILIDRWMLFAVYSFVHWWRILMIKFRIVGFHLTFSNCRNTPLFNFQPTDTQ